MYLCIYYLSLKSIHLYNYLSSIYIYLCMCLSIHLYNCLSFISIYIYLSSHTTYSFIYSFFDRHTGCFHILAPVYVWNLFFFLIWIHRNRLEWWLPGPQGWGGRWRGKGDEEMLVKEFSYKINNLWELIYSMVRVVNITWLCAWILLSKP